MAFFKEEDTNRAKEEIKAWKAKHVEAAKELQEIWKKNVPTAGHKEMAREVVKEPTK